MPGSPIRTSETGSAFVKATSIAGILQPPPRGLPSLTTVAFPHRRKDNRLATDCFRVAAGVFPAIKGSAISRVVIRLQPA
jgi:hypothetical protein